MKIWERRLMKDFQVVPVTTDEETNILLIPPENETSIAKFRRVAKMFVDNSNVQVDKWNSVVKEACQKSVKTCQFSF